VAVSASLSPPGEPCIGSAGAGGSCTEVSYTGDYSPLAYLLPAVGISAAHAWNAALLVSRVVSLLQVLAFLLLALILTGPRLGWRTVGLLVATTPMVLFVGAMMNPNGLEIAANLAFIAALLKLRRDPGGFPGWAWIALIASGAATVLAWQLGPFFVVADIAVWAALMGIDGSRALFAIRGSQLLTAAGVTTAAVGLFLAWGGAAGTLHSTVTFASPLSALHAGLRQLGPALKGAVGNFGVLNVPLPALMIGCWWLAVILLFAAGVSLGTRRERVALVLAAVLGLGFPVAFFAFSYRLSGFGIQGRYILPILAITPMLAGDAIEGARSRQVQVRVAGLWRPCLVGFALFQLIAWWINAHHYAPSGLLAGAGVWSPPLGWRLWLVVAVVGAAAVALAAAVAVPPSSVRRHGRGRIGSIKLRAG
jgi:predicted membrane protein DUF2142